MSEKLLLPVDIRGANLDRRLREHRFILVPNATDVCPYHFKARMVWGYMVCQDLNEDKDGVSINKMAETLDMPWHSIDEILHMGLIPDGLAKEVNGGYIALPPDKENSKYFRPREGEGWHNNFQYTKYYLLNTPKQISVNKNIILCSILSFARDGKGTTRSGLAKGMGCNRNTVAREAKEMFEMNIILKNLKLIDRPDLDFWIPEHTIKKRDRDYKRDNQKYVINENIVKTEKIEQREKIEMNYDKHDEKVAKEMADNKVRRERQKKNEERRKEMKALEAKLEREQMLVFADKVEVGQS